MIHRVRSNPNYFTCSFLPAAVWTETNSRFFQNSSSSPTQSSDDCEYTVPAFCFFFSHPSLQTLYLLQLSRPSLPPFMLFLCLDVVTWSIWKHGHGAVSGLLSGLRVQVLCQVSQRRSVLLLRGEKEHVCVCGHYFKRWECARSDCCAWNRQEFLSSGTDFSQRS